MDTQLIPALLSGGGFVFLTALIGGLAMYNKNKSDAIKSLAEGARDVVELLREQLAEVRDEHDKCEKKLDGLEQSLTDLRENYRIERRSFVLAAEKYKAWNDVLVKRLETRGIHVDPPPRFNGEEGR